jgi:hypothetical protein
MVKNSLEKELASLFTPCRTGKHLWFFEEDAAMC